MKIEPKFSGAGHVTCPKCDDLHIIRCEMVKRVCIQKGPPHNAIYSPCYINYSNYAKMESVNLIKL